MALMLKDLTLATQMAERPGAKRVLGVKGLDTYSLLNREAEYRDWDVRAMFRYIGGQGDWEQHDDEAEGSKADANGSNGHYGLMAKLR